VAEHEWNFAKAKNACSVCQTAFVPEQRYYSALIQTPAVDGAPGGMDRQDFCTACFEAKRPENIFYFWKAALPLEDGEKPHRPRIDIEYVFEFFKRLEGDNGPQRVAFRYILALMLSRKKVVIFEGKKKDAAGNEVHLFREKRGGQIHQVVEPALSEDEITSVSAELGVLLGLTAPTPKTPPAEAVPVAAPVAESAAPTEATPTEAAPGEMVEANAVAAAPVEHSEVESNIAGEND